MSFDELTSNVIDMEKVVIIGDNCNNQTEVNCVSNAEMDDQNKKAKTSLEKDLSVVKQETVVCERSNLKHKNQKQSYGRKNTDNKREPQTVILEKQFVKEEIYLNDNSAIIIKKEVALNNIRNDKHENTDISYICDLCQESFNKKSLLEAHIQIHMLKCTVCSIACFSEDSLTKHAQSHYITPMSINFDESIVIYGGSKEDKRNEDLDMKMNLWSNAETGNKIMFIKEEMQIEDVKNRNKEGNSTQCNSIKETEYSSEPQKIIVEKIFIKEEKRLDEDLDIINKELILSEIMRCIETNSEITNVPYICDICNENFNKKYLLETHIRTHSFKCTECPRFAYFEDSTIKHIEQHTNQPKPQIKRKVCNICNQKFNRLDLYKDHMFVHMTDERPHVCSVCDMSFYKEFYLKLHSRTHQERTCVCSVCNKGFVTPNVLKRHMVLHTGERPYKCTGCDKAFAFKASLMAHISVHTGERPFVCSICKKTFRRLDILKKHLVLHEKELLVKGRVKRTTGDMWYSKGLAHLFK